MRSCTQTNSLHVLSLQPGQNLLSQSDGALKCVKTSGMRLTWLGGMEQACLVCFELIDCYEASGMVTHGPRLLLYFIVFVMYELWKTLCPSIVMNYRSCI